jgi:hypothetical protein
VERSAPAFNTLKIELRELDGNLVTEDPAPPRLVFVHANLLPRLE